jgi:FkbM family methyltransferase
MKSFLGNEAYQRKSRLFELNMLGIRERYRNEAIIRGLCQGIYIGADSVLCRVLGRYKMFVDARDVGLSSHLMLDGYWEMWLTEAFAEVIRPGMTVVDVGANLGYFTLLMAELVGPTGLVHAFEPNPKLVARLKQSVAVNGFAQRVEVHEQALSNSEGRFKLFVPDQEPKNGYLSPYDEGDSENCLHTRRLDSYPELSTASVIKIDADISEQQIWEGMAGLLEGESAITIFLEFSRVRYQDAAAFLDQLIESGLSLSCVTFDRGIEATTKEEILSADAVEDIMLVLRR